MAALPAGLVTFVFTDIEGSTRLLENLGDLYHEVLTRHHEIIRGAISVFHGHEIKTDGDAFFLAFGDASDAVNAAIRLQRDLLRETWPENGAVQVRIGMHTGPATPVEGRDYVALAVNQASRIAAAAHGGQIVVSAETAQSAKEGRLGRATFRGLGRYRLKDFDKPVHSWRSRIRSYRRAFLHCERCRTRSTPWVWLERRSSDGNESSSRFRIS